MKTSIEVTSPYDNKVIDTIFLEDEAAVFAKLEKAHQAFMDKDNWLTKIERCRILAKLIHLMSAQREELAKLAAFEGGKPLQDSFIEVDRAIQGIKIALHAIEDMKGEMIPMGHTPSSSNRLAFTIKEPIGVVFSLSAFNHPLNLIVHQVIPAVAVSAPVIIKPAKATPLSCINFAKLLWEAGLPEQWCQTIVCENEITSRLVKDPRVQFLSFVGSAKVGWQLRSSLAPGADCALEHGGAAPVIVEKDANIKSLIPALLKAGFYHAGQVCVSVQRIYVHEKIMDKVSKKLVEGAKTLIVGDPLDIKTEVGPLITISECDRIEEWVAEAKDKGAQILCGGRRINDELYEPTVILSPPTNAQVSFKEIFGPVICLYPYNNRTDAINEANSLPFSFQASIYSQDMDIVMDSVNRLKADAVMVNEHPAFRVDWMPFGGSEHSGLGKGGIAYSMEDMTKEKLVVIQSKTV
jgi:acyl-CoA reductase-like NAD-dependent aldehyde dehydrogenase